MKDDHSSKRKRVTFEELVTIAKRRFEEKLSITKIAQLLGRDERVIVRAISRAFRMGLVEVALVEPALRHPPRVPRLEHALLNRFSQLSACIIIDPEDSSNSLKSGNIHADLGKVVAKEIARGSFFRNGDIIGIGPGRGCYHTMDALAKYPKLSHRNIVITSLTGSVCVKDAVDGENANTLVDADQIVGQVGQRFSRSLKLRPMGHSIAYSDSSRKDIIKSTVLDPEIWEKKHPTVAFIGAGVLSSGHRFFDEANRAALDREPLLLPIYEFLDPLVRICKEYQEQHNHCPVADLNYRLFYLPLAKSSSLDEAKIMRLINDINARLLTPTLEQLKLIQTIVLVSGGKFKAPAIKYLLNDGFPITILATDKVTAEALLK